MAPLGLSQNALARAVGVPPRRINEIVLGKRRLTPDTALRLGRYFHTSPRYWLGLQLEYDLGVETARLAGRLEREITPHGEGGPVERGDSD